MKFNGYVLQIYKKYMYNIKSVLIYVQSLN